MTEILLDESAPGKLTLEHCCVFARPELLGFTDFEKENTSVHTRRHCGACDFALGNQPAKPQPRNSFNGFALVDKSGNIKKPADSRDLYQTLGTYFVLDPKGGKSDAPDLRFAGTTTHR
jgi:hypothetical protein